VATFTAYDPGVEGVPTVGDRTTNRARKGFARGDGDARNRAVSFQIASSVLWISGAVVPAAVGLAIALWPHHRASATTTAMRVLEGRF